jgi:hypothetical protein
MPQSYRQTLGENMMRDLGPNVRFLTRIVVSCFWFAGIAHGQAPQNEKPPMADEVFKNIQVLKGLTVDQFMSTMGFISAALNMNCADCHDTSSTEAFALDNAPKRTARRMIAMVNTINKNNFGGRREVTCYSCHRADPRPKVTPRLSDQYGTPQPEDPNEAEPRTRPAPNAPSPEQVFNKYIQALGGPQRLANLTRFVGHGTYEGFDTGGDKVPVDVYAKAPNLRTTVVHDPKVLTKPWTSAPNHYSIGQVPMGEYYCTDNQDSKVLNPNGVSYISASGLDERYFDEDEYQELLKEAAAAKKK